MTDGSKVRHVSFPIRVILFLSLTVATLSGSHAAPDIVTEGRRAMLEEIGFHAYEKIELSSPERCPHWLVLNRYDGECRRLTVMYRGIHLSGVLLQQNVPVNRLTIYHVGHESTPITEDPNGDRPTEGLYSLKVERVGEDAAWLLRQLYERKEDLLVLFMPGLGLAPGNAETETVHKVHRTMAQHHSFSLLDYPGDSAAAYFIAHVKAFLDRYGKPYRRVTMIGRSGGGWATTLAAAYEPRITCSISFFGTLPMRLRLPIQGDNRNDLGDFEQYGFYLYKRLDYLDLYAQAVSSSRQHTQVYNFKDDCCFSGEIKGAKVSGLFSARYPRLSGFHVDIIPVRSQKDHGNLDDSALTLINRRCPAK